MSVESVWPRLGAAAAAGQQADPVRRRRAQRRRQGLGRRRRALGADVPGRVRGRPAQPGRADPLRGAQRAARRAGRAHVRGLARPRGADARARRPAVHRRRAPAGAARSTCSGSRSPPSSATRTCSPRSISPASRSGRRPRRRRPDRAGRRARRVQPRADRRLHRRRRARRRRGGGPRDHRRSSGTGRPRAGRAAATSCCCGWPAPRASTCRASTTSTTCPTAGSSGSCRTAPDVPFRVHKRTDDGPRRVAVPEEAAGPAGRDGARAVRGGDLPRLHPRLPVLPGRHDHPPGPGAVDHHGRRDGQGGPGVLRLRRGRPAVAVSAPTTPRSATCAPGLADRYEGTNVSLSLPSHPGRRVQHRPGQRAVPQRPAHRPDLRPRGRLGADPQGDQQDGHRGGPDPDRRHGVRATAGGR